MANYALAVCQTYADAFCAEKGDGLLIHGACGVGKSFLGAAVARRVMERGYYVHCISAIELFSIYERSRFGRCEEDERFVLEAALEADLLFLDDLGNEVASPQNAPFLARLLNERINGKKGTILVSQYSYEELAKRYSPQIGSRIKGSLTDIYIMGSDLRNQIK